MSSATARCHIPVPGIVLGPPTTAAPVPRPNPAGFRRIRPPAAAVILGPQFLLDFDRSQSLIEYSLIGKRAIRYRMREEFEKMAAAGKLERHHIESLVQLTNSGFCMHRSWGFGRIKTVDTVFARFTIDFTNKPGHAMDLAFAAESLKPIPKDHILARKANDLEGVRHLAAHHLDLIKLVLNSFGGKATA